MTLRTKTLWIIGITLGGLIALLYAGSQKILLDSFVDLENESIHRSIRRGTHAITNDIDSLVLMAQDWAYWDDTYGFVQDPAAHQSYALSNLVESTYSINELDCIILLDTTGNSVYAGTYGLDSGEELALIEHLHQHLTPGSVLLQTQNHLGPIGGLLVVSDNVLMVASLPILTSEQQGPIQGTLLFGRFLSPSRIQQIGRISDLQLTIHSYHDPRLPVDFRLARNKLESPTTFTTRVVSPSVIAGYGVINDIYDQPALIVRVEMPRDIYEQGQTSIWYFLLALVSLGVVFCVMVLALLESTVLSPLGRLISSVDDVAKRSDPSARISIERRGELSKLADAVNDMLDALEESQKTIRDREERLRTVVSNAPVILYALNKQGNFTLLEGRSLGTLVPGEYMGQPAKALFGDTPAVVETLKHSLVGEDYVGLIEMQGSVFEVYHHPLIQPNGVVDGIIGVAIDITERKRAEAAEHGQRLMAEALRNTAAALTGTLNLDEVLERILTSVGQVMPYDATTIMLIDDGMASVARSHGFTERGLTEWISNLRVSVSDTSYLQQVLETGQLLIIPDTQTSSDWIVDPEMSWVRSFASAPVHLDQHVIGVLNLYSETAGCFSDQQTKRLQIFADQAALAIHNAQLYAAERHERLLAQTLQKTAEALGAPVTLEETLNLIIEQLSQVVTYDHVAMMLDEGDWLQVVGAQGESGPNRILKKAYVYQNVPLYDASVRAEHPLVLDIDPDSAGSNIFPGITSSTRTWIGVPLVVRDIVVGFLSLASNQPQAYARRDVLAVAAFAQQAALALENARILTELETSLEELREAETHLIRTARLSAAGEIAAGVAHQINNPLTAVIAEAHLLLQDIDPDDPRYESAAAIREAANRAGAIVQRLLDLTRSHPYAIQSLDINFSLENALSLVRAQIVPHIASLEVALSSDLPPVDASEQHLEDVWINLMLNARDAVSEAEGGMIKITSGLNITKNAIKVTIQDNGPGIPMENLNRIFEPLFTTKDYGTGLGLSICHDVVLRHGGTIQVDSVEGQGTTFTVLLPFITTDSIGTKTHGAYSRR